MFECIFGIIILIVGIIVSYSWFNDTYNGTERWCEDCDEWGVMKLSEKIFKCENCGHDNQRFVGCPKCGWYGRYEIRYRERTGPFFRQINYSDSVMMFKETWNCPKHGDYEFDIAASESQDWNLRKYDDNYRDW